MKNIIYILLIFLSVDDIAGQTVIELLELKAFPTAHGFGRYATGGRGGDVYIVTNLESSGSGSFKNGYVSTSGPRTIIFNVSGNIDYGSTMFASNPNITIAGQTAPGDGIALYSTTGGISNEMDNFIWRHIRFRGTDNDRSNLRIIPTSANITKGIVDHCSFSWADPDEMNIDISGSTSGNYTTSGITVQYCISTQCDRNFLIYKYGYHVSLLRSLMSITNQRAIRSNYPDLVSPNVIIFEEINNILHGFNTNPITPSIGTKFTARANILTKATDMEQAYGSQMISGESTGTGIEANTWAYIPDNINNYPGQIQKNLSGYQKETPYETTDYVGDHIINANNLLSSLEDYLGARWNNGRDSVDANAITQVHNGSGTYVYDGILPVLSSDDPYTDSDNDGIPDSFESEHGITDKNEIKDNWDFGEYKIINTAGYTNLEMYLNWKAGDFKMMVDGIEEPDSSWQFIEPTPTPTVVRPWMLRMNGKPVRLQLGTNIIN